MLTHMGTPTDVFYIKKIENDNISYVFAEHLFQDIILRKEKNQW